MTASTSAGYYQPLPGRNPAYHSATLGRLPSDPMRRSAYTTVGAPTSAGAYASVSIEGSLRFNYCIEFLGP